MVACCSSLAGGSRSVNPLFWPAGDLLEAAYHWRYDQEFDATLYTSAVGQPAITWSGVVPIDCGLAVEVTTTGARNAMVLRWSAKNGDGTDWVTLGPGLGASVALGNGITLALPTGTYTSGTVWRMKRGTWRDTTGNLHHLLSIDGTLLKKPYARYTAKGGFLQFDGVDHGLSCTTALAANVVGGTAKAFYLVGVFQIDNFTYSGAVGSLLFFGDGASAHSMQWNYLSTPAVEMRSQNDAGTNRNFNGGAPDTALHCYECWSDGADGVLRIDGVQVATGAIMSGALTVNRVVMGKTFNGGAEGNPGAASWGALNMYNDLPTATQRDDIAGRMMAGFGL